MKKIFITHVVFLTCSLLSWSASQEQQDAPTTTASTTSQREPTLEELIRGWLSTFRPDTPKSLTPQELEKALGFSHCRRGFYISNPSAFFPTLPTNTAVLDLTQMRPAGDFAEHLGPQLRNFPQLVALHMDSFLINPSNTNWALREKLGLLAENFPPSLRTLQISGFELRDPDAISLAPLMGQLVSLDLSNTRITDSFLNQILRNTDPDQAFPLKALNLSSNVDLWKEGGATCLAEFLGRTPDLENLNLSNSFADCPLSVISAICEFTKLRILNLSNTFINTEALKKLQGKLSSLEKLYFSRTIQPDGEGESIPLLLDFIKSLLNLDTLEVEDIGFTDAHTGKIIEALTELRKLKTVNLMLSLLTVQGIHTLEHYCRLKTVTLSVETNNPRENYGTSL